METTPARKGVSADSMLIATVVGELHARLLVSEATRDAAQAEATRQTLLARDVRNAIALRLPDAVDRLVAAVGRCAACGYVESREHDALPHVFEDPDLVAVLRDALGLDAPPINLSDRQEFTAAARSALDHMCRAVAPDNAYTDAVDRLDAALSTVRLDDS